MFILFYLFLQSLADTIDMYMYIYCYPPVTVANVHLEKSCVKYRGVYIVCHLTWLDHIDYICGKISKNINMMVNLKHYVSNITVKL